MLQKVDSLLNNSEYCPISLLQKCSDNALFLSFVKVHSPYISSGIHSANIYLRIGELRKVDFILVEIKTFKDYNIIQKKQFLIKSS